MSILPKKITFICVGNICRSPLSEYYCRFLAHKSELLELQSMFFDSAGINGGNLPLARRTQLFLESRGIDTLNFRSKKVSTEYFLDFDMIIVMETYLKSYILKYYFNHEDPAIKSKIAGRIFVYGDLAELSVSDIPDPYLESDSLYREVTDLLQQGCENLIQKWTRLQKQSWAKRQILQVRQILGYNIYE